MKLMVLIVIAVIGFAAVPVSAAQPELALEILTDCRAAFGGEVGVLKFGRIDGDWQLISVDASRCPRVNLKPIEYCSSLVSLDIRYESEGDEELTRAGIEAIARFPNLRTLTMNAKDFVGILGIEHTSFPSVEALGVVGACRDIDFVLSRLDAFPRLNALAMEAELTNESLSLLRDSEGLKSLQIIDAKFTDDAMKHISRLRQLRSLELPWCYEISAKGVQELVTLEGLRGISLEGVDKSMITVLEKLPALEVLTCSLFEDGADLRGLRQLRSWNISPIGSPKVPPFEVLLPAGVERIGSQYEYLPGCGEHRGQRQCHGTIQVLGQFGQRLGKHGQ
jgi:hypothetical protein